MPIPSIFKQVVVLLLFNFIIFFSYSQNNDKIYVSEWVNRPKEQDFLKPLIYVDFWATWCAPCIRSMPHTASLQNEFGQNVLFIYISNEPSGKIEKFMKKRNLHFFSGVDSTGHNIETFEVTTLPHSILIDNEGRVVWEGKPYEMNKKLLKNFVNLYKYEEGNVSRIKEVKAEKNENVWDIYIYKDSKIKYIVGEDFPNEFSNNNNEYFISGSLKYFFSFINNIPSYQIKSNIEIDKNYMLSCKAENLKDFKKILNSFIQEVCGVSVLKTKIKKKVFLLNQVSTENYFNINMYDFEKGNNTVLIDDMSVMIDNATVQEAISKLSSLSDQIFIFNGNDKNRYDWNLHYKHATSTIEQLKELGFDILEKEKEIDFYILSD